MTWFPRGYDPGETPRVSRDSGLYGYLNGSLGFGVSLTGGSLGDEEPGPPEAL